MKAALILCPFFTNGDYPCLGLASINGALMDAGHDTACFDFCWLAYRDWPGEYHLLRQFFGVGLVKDEIVFVLNPELGLYILFGEDAPGFKWRISDDAQIRQAAGMLYLGLGRMVPGWADRILDEGPDAAFFSTYASNIFVSLYLARHLKRKRPGLPVIFGGPGVSLPEMQEFILSTGFVDAVVVGEGELTAREVCSDIDKALSAGVPGLAIIKDDIIFFQPRPLASVLDSIPLPSYEGFPMPGLEYKAYQANRPNRYLTPFFEGLPVSSTRGCVNRCAYCSEKAYWSRFRQRKVDTVIKQIAEFNTRFGERRFLFNDSALNGNPRWLEEFCEGIISRNRDGFLPFQPTFSSYLIADRSIEDILSSKMYDAGFSYCTLGVETFSGTIRERMNKRMSGDEIFASILALTRAGINVKVNLLVGFPGETDEEFESSLRYIEKWSGMSRDERGSGHLFWDAGHTVRLEAYSDLYHEPDKYGITISSRELPFPDSISFLKESLSKILLKWSMSVERGVIKKRVKEIERMSDKANKS